MVIAKAVYWVFRLGLMLATHALKLHSSPAPASHPADDAQAAIARAKNLVALARRTCDLSKACVRDAKLPFVVNRKN